MSGLFSQPLIIQFIREVGASEHNSVQTHPWRGREQAPYPAYWDLRVVGTGNFWYWKEGWKPSEARDFRYPPPEILSQWLGALLNWMASRFALLVRFFWLLPNSSWTANTARKTLPITVILVLLFPRLTWKQAAQRHEKMKRTMEKVRELHWTLKEICFDFYIEGRGTYERRLSQSTCTRPSKCNLDMLFLEKTLFWYEICWSVPKITKLHRLFSLDTHAPPLEMVFFASVNDTFRLKDSYCNLVPYSTQ